MGGTWKDAEAPSFGDIPDGKYQIRIESANINNAKSSGRLQVSWQLEILSGEYAGRKLFKHDGIEDEQSQGYFRGGLARLGVEWPDDPSDLPDVLEGLQGTLAQVTAKTREGSEYQNVYFDKALDSSDVEEGGTEAEGEAEAEETEEAPWEAAKGDRVTANIDGTDYTGEVTKIKNGTATVKFDDGDVLEIDVSDLAQEEGEEPEAEEEGGEEAEEETEGEAEAEAEEESSEATVNADGINPKTLLPLKSKIEALAKKNGFTVADYANSRDLLSDLAEFVGVSGTFKDGAKLWAAVEKAAKAAK